MPHIKDLKPDKKNARKHNPRNIGLIEKSLQEVGAARSIVIDEDNNILAGNGTVEAAAQAGITKLKIVQADGNEIVAVQRKGLTKQQKERLALYDNRTAELAEWDVDVLKDMDFEGMFYEGEIDDLFPEEKEERDSEPQIDKAAELNKKWKVKSGDLWQIGEHRLLCGDSTADKTPYDGCDTIIFDPGWDEGHAAVPGNSVLAFCDGSTIGNVVSMYGSPVWLFAWDCVASWYVPNRPLRRMKLCAWYGDIKKYDMDGAHYGDAGEERTVSNTRGKYTFTPDARGKHLSDIFSKPITKLHAESEHSHSKPEEWMRMLIANCTRGNVYDPFLGSGTTMVACQNLNRKCYGIEISPEYCAVILQRMSDAFDGIEIKRIKETP